jgi:long-chain fatty acid transport protein
MIHRIAIAAAASILGGAAAPASAGGYALSEQSAVAGGTGGASTARSDDAGAAWYNPAALADGGGLRLGAGFIAARAQLSVTASDGSFSADSEPSLETPPQLHASYASGELAAGIAVGVPFGSGVRWPSDWAGRHEIVASKVIVIRAAPFVAYRLGRVRIAGGIHIDSGRLNVERGLDFIDAEGDVALDLRGWGVGLDLAAFATVGAGVDLGLSYKSRTSMDLSGGADFEAPDEFSMRAVDQEARAALAIPDRIALGAALHRRGWRGFADLELSLWGVNDELVVDFEREATPDARQVNDWRPGFAVRGGAELDLAAATAARAGLLVDLSPAPTSRLAPSSPDSHRLGATAGLSQRLPRSLSLDVFYEYLHLVAREASNPESLAARYSGRAHLVGLGLRWQP